MGASTPNGAPAFERAAIPWERSDARSCCDFFACERTEFWQAGEKRRGEHGPGFAIVDLGDLATGGRLHKFPDGSLPTLTLIKLD
jgi:hypothetical protein